MPLVQQLTDKYQSRGLVILNISINGDIAAIARYMAEKNYTIPTLVDTDGNVRNSYRIQFVPTAFFIDKDGFIRDKQVGGWENLEQIEQRLTKILN